MIIDFFSLENSTRMYYYMLIFILLVMLLFKNHKLIATEYTKISKKTWYALIIIVLIGFILRLAFTPMQTITNVSVWSNRYAAVKISEEQIIRSEMHTRGYSLLMSPLYSLTGDIVWSAHTFDIVVGSLSVIMLFLLTYLLFKDQKAAMISAFILCLLPWHIFFSGTHGMEITASFFGMLSIILIFLSIKSKEPDIYFLAFISLLFCALVRKEQMILLIVFIIYFLIKKNPVKMQRKYHVITYLLTAAVLFLPFIIDALHGKIEEGLLESGYISQNVISILEIFKYNFYIILLMLAPIVLYVVNKKIIIKKSEKILFLVLWFSITIIPFLIHRDIHTRYFVFFLVPFIILGSFAISGLLKTKYKIQTSLILVAALLFSVTYVYSECAENSNCKYLIAQPLEKTDTKLSKIHAILNNTNKEDMLVLFLDNQAKEAYITLYGNCHPYIVLDDGEAWKYYNSQTISDEGCIEDKAVNQYGNYNIYLIFFEDDIDLQLAEEILIDRKRELYYSGDIYEIYHYANITQ